MDDGGLGLTDPRETTKTEYEHSTHITNKQPKSTLKSSILTTTPLTTSLPYTRKKEYDKRKMKIAKTSVMNLWQK